MTSSAAHDPGFPGSKWTGTTAGLGWRLLLSILGPVVWLSFTLLYVGFWSPGFSLFQSIIVILVSLLVLGGVMGAAWASWGIRHHAPGR